MLKQLQSLQQIQKIALGLFILPVISSLIALNSGIFFFKSAVAGSCIIILILFFKTTKNKHKIVWFIIGAFVFSIAGDWFLSNKNDDFLMFATGIGLFFWAHIGYLGYALKNGRINLPVTIILLISYLTFFFTMLQPAIESTLLVVTSFIYLLISCVSVGAASGMIIPRLAKSIYILGISLILFSDTIISFHEFIGYNEMNFLILPTYYLAQISVTIAVILTASVFGNLNRRLSGL